MIAGAVLGAVCGYFFGDFMLDIKFLGTIFLNALKMVVVPLVVASMIVGVASLGDIRKLGRTSLKTLAYYLTTTGISVLIGIVLVNLVKPGSGVELFGGHIPDIVDSSRGKTLIDVVTGLIPANIFKAASEGQILPFIVFSLLFGGVLTSIGSVGKPVLDFFVGINVIMMKIVMLSLLLIQTVIKFLIF